MTDTKRFGWGAGDVEPVGPSRDAANPYHGKDGKFTHRPGGSGAKAGGMTKSGLSPTKLGRGGEKLLIANQRAAKISKRFGKTKETAKTAQGQNPIDVESDTHAIEVKTMDSRSVRLQITMKPNEVSRKEAAAKELGKEPAVVAQVYDHGSGRMYVFAYEGGFRQPGHTKGNFEVMSAMEQIGSYEVSEAELIEASERPHDADAKVGDEDAMGRKVEAGDFVIEMEKVEGEWVAVIAHVAG